MTTMAINSIPRAYAYLAVLLVGLTAGAIFIYREYFQTYHYAEVSKGILYRTGFRSLRELNTALLSSPDKSCVVVSLLDGNENLRPPFSEESEFCRRSRIKYKPIPIRLGGWPTTDDVQLFLRIAEAKVRPVIVHCAQGVRRTGMMVAAYQMSVMGWDKEKTKAAMLTFGHSDRTVNDIKRFIDVYDPKTRTVTQQLEQSTE